MDSHSSQLRLATLRREVGIGSSVSETGIQVTSPPRRAWSPFRLTRCWLIVLLITAPLLAIGGSIAAVNWPFRYKKIHPLLEDMFGNQVKIARYHRTYFPNPGFVATGLTLTHKSGGSTSPLGTIDTLSVEGRWSDLLSFRDRVRLVEITALHLLVPASGAAARSNGLPTTDHQQSPQQSNVSQFEGPDTAIEDLRIHNSLLDILRVNGGRYTFAINSLDITGLQKGHPWHYTVDMENPKPSGHIAATGNFGPLNQKDVGATPVSGQFTFNHVKLSDIGILHGTLASTGSFNGPLRAMQADAVSDTPDFSVDDGLPTPIRGAIHCIVDGLNGDVIMPQVEVATGHTVVHAHGQVAGSPKLTQLDIDVDNGRAEELLHPFVHNKVPILGPATLHSHAFVAAPGKPFLQRLVLDGRFDAPAVRTVDRQTEKSLSDFSRRQQQNDHNPKALSDPPADGDVLSSLRGPAAIRNGIISTSGLIFQLPGATATLRGTFVLHGQSVHLAGTLKMDASISHAATGWKSVFLKPLEPFFHRKDRSGSEIPIAVVGTPGHYSVTQDLAHQK